MLYGTGRALLGGRRFRGAYDAIANLVHVYEPARRTLTSYTGALARLRRDSDDAEADFGYVANGDLDVAAIAAWAGGAAYVVTVYDQVGGDHVTQATEANQPLYVASAQNGHAGMTFDGGNYLLTSAVSTFRNASGGQIVVVSSAANTTGTKTVVFINNGTVGGQSRAQLGYQDAQLRVGGRRLDEDAFDVTNGGSHAANTVALYETLFDWADSAFYVSNNGVASYSDTDWLTNGNTSNTDSMGLALGASLTNTNALVGKITSVVILSIATASANLRTAMNSYWGVY